MATSHAQTDLTAQMTPGARQSRMRTLALASIKRLAIMVPAESGLATDVPTRPADVELSTTNVLGRTNRGYPRRPGAMRGVRTGNNPKGTEACASVHRLLIPCSRALCDALVPRIFAIKAARAAGRDMLCDGDGCMSRICSREGGKVWQPTQFTARQLAFGVDALESLCLILRRPVLVTDMTGWLVNTADTVAIAHAAIAAGLRTAPPAIKKMIPPSASLIPWVTEALITERTGSKDIDTVMKRPVEQKRGEGCLATSHAQTDRMRNGRLNSESQALQPLPPTAASVPLDDSDLDDDFAQPPPWKRHLTTGPLPSPPISPPHPRKLSPPSPPASPPSLWHQPPPASLPPLPPPPPSPPLEHPPPTPLAVARTWALTHKVWNALCHALWGNTCC